MNKRNNEIPVEKILMKAMKAIGYLSVLIVAAVLVQDAAAFPTSTYGKATGWENQTEYKKNGLDIGIAWTVFDTQLYPTEFTWAGAVAKPATDRYVYVYQIWNLTGSKDVTSFGLLKQGGDEITQSIMHSTTAQMDTTGMGLMPDPDPSEKQGVWAWSTTGAGIFSAEKYSAYLILSSDRAPTKGTYAVNPPSEPSGELPVPTNPEPTTLALISVAAGFIFPRAKRRVAIGKGIKD